MGNEVVTPPMVKGDGNERSSETGGFSRDSNNNQGKTLSAWKDRFSWGGGGASLTEDCKEEIRPTFRDVYMLQNRIGTGSNSQVFSAVERTTGRQVAVKAIHHDWLDKRRVEFLRAEVDIHREVSSHPYVVRLLGVFDDPEASYIVEELAPGGSLLELLHSRDRMGTEGEVRLLLRRLLAAAQFLHDRGIVHRDIKPENLLIMREGAMESAKLADFGFATRLTGQATAIGPACGTPEYVAPEILLQQPFCGKADVWSAGVTAFCLLSGALPFHGHTVDALYTAVLDGACSYAGPDWSRVSSQATDFVRKMLTVDPEERWTASQLLEHPWMTGEDAGVELGEKFGRGGGVYRRWDGGIVRRRRVRLKTVALAIVIVIRLVRRARRRARRRRQPQELGSP